MSDRFAYQHQLMARFACRLRGHKLPQEIRADHPALTVTWRGRNAVGGVARAIPCGRCGDLIGPMADGYPMIMP